MELPVHFIETIDNLYNSIINNEIYRDIWIEGFYDLLGTYEYLIGEKARKKGGSYYTPPVIVRFILENVMKDVDIAVNPYIKILDPSCGCGYFLSEAYNILKKRFIENIDAVNALNPGINLNKDNLHRHILEYNIFGADVDELGVKLATLNLMLKDRDHRIKPNIICCDSLINWEDTILPERDFWENKFEIIIGNPPYIGHKSISGQYRKDLNHIYGDIFKDKADISFCFIKSSIDRLSKGGRLSFITSRYFIESPSGRALRSYIKESCTIEKIIDFYGVRIMKGISVDPVIISFSKSVSNNKNSIKVSKAEISLKEMDDNNVFCELESNNNKNYKNFFISQDVLSDDGWVLCPPDEMGVLDRIKKSLKYKLSDICTSFQGIITGCDRAFIVNDAIINKYEIERDIVRRWIKNSHINKYDVEEGNLYILYSDFIEDEDKYKASISYIAKYRERLLNRRECKRGVRKWYQLQWGRNSSLFEGKKIVFPYKSSKNRFAIDMGSYSSADVYGMTLKESYAGRISYEFLLGLLNSKLYEFYFKSYAKKLGDHIYDYYPNTVMRLLIPCQEDEFITSRVRKLLSCTEESTKAAAMGEIDRHLYKTMGLEQHEIEIVERIISRS